MQARNQLRTTRFSAQEAKRVDEYISKNNIFDSFSSLSRVATLRFIQEEDSLELVKFPRSSQKRPTFLWDYDLSEYDVREILHQKGMTQKKLWLIERILSQARFDEVTSYLDLDTIRIALPLIRLSHKIKDRWQYALEKWKSHG